MNSFSKIRNFLFKAFVPSVYNSHKPHILKDYVLIVTSFIVVFTKLSLIVLLAVYPSVSFSAEITSSKIMELANEERARNNIQALDISYKLNQAAYLKAQDIINRQYFDHTSPDGIDPWHWFEASGYSYKYAGENLAIDFITAEGAHRGWMNSPSHKANILNPNFTEIGIGIYKGIFDGQETIVIVQLFGTPLASKESLPVEENTILEEKIEEDRAPIVSLGKLEPPKIETSPHNIYVGKNGFEITGKISIPSEILIYYRKETGDDFSLLKTFYSKSRNFSINTKNLKLEDGSHALAFTSKIGDKESTLSSWHSFNQDTRSPKIDISKSYLETISNDPLRFYFQTAVKDENLLSLEASIVNVPLKLNKENDIFKTNIDYSAVKEIINQNPIQTIKIHATDRAGNISTTEVAADFTKEKSQTFEPQVLGATAFVTQSNNFNKILQKIIIGLILFFVISFLVNIFIKIGIQHPTTILNTIIFIVLLTALVLI